MGLRKLSPGGHEYLTNSVACGDRDRRLEPGELLSDYYLSRGYPAGQWFGAGAEALGLAGAVAPAQMNALFGEGRHPNADAIEAQMIADGASAAEAVNATKLGRRFPQYSALDHLRSNVAKAYQDYNREHGRPVGAPIPKETRAQLRREVQVQAFRYAHNGADPIDEKEFQRWLAEQQRALKTAVSGFEMVFAPDKSVSIAWALAGPDERELIGNLVHQAARDTLSYLERNAAFTRRGSMGEAQVDVNGITAALFEHWDSRASDPHLHIHALVSSKVQRSDDGQWTALDGRTVLAATVTASEFFDNRLRDLFRQHGAAWVRRGAEGVDLTRPVWQLEGVPVELVRAFSQRHRQFEAARAKRIVAFRNAHGREPKPKEIFEIDRQAQYDHRPGKPPPRTLEEHTTAWREHAEDVVDTPVLDQLGRRVFRQRQQRADAADVLALARDIRDVASENYAHFSWWNLAAEAHRQSAHLTVSPGDREQLVDDLVTAVLEEPDTLAITGPTVEEPPSLRRRDGESVFVEARSTRYTTTATLAAEQQLVAWACRGGGHRLRVDTLNQVLAGQRLNPGQERMVREFARSGRRVQLALAPAGTGKTTTMKALATAWRRTGHEVYAFGPSARAAQELGDAIGATPHTLHQLTTTQRLGFAHRAFPIEAGDLVVVDEAAMAGTHTLHAVLRYALNRGADVRLIGDDAQLAAVEAGGAIRLIAHDVGAVRLHEVVRFRGPDRAEQAKASLAIRYGNPEGLRYYLDNQRVASGSIETMRDEAHAAWHAEIEAGMQSLLIVPSNEDTTLLNREARATRQSRGELPRGREVELHDTTAAGVGDWVVTRHNQRLLSLFGGKDFVKNGDVWTITRVHLGGRITVQHRVHGGTITLPSGYVRAHVELAYAATVNRIQGMTATGNAHLLVPGGMTREQLYPGITRAVQQNFLYVVTHHHVIDQHQETPDPATAQGVLTGVLERSGAEASATDTLRDTLAAAESMGTLVARYNYAATYRDEDRYHALLTRHAPEVVGLDSEPALVQTLRNAHDLGWRPEQLLRTVLHRRPLTGAEDPGAVVQARITRHIGRHPPPDPVGIPHHSDITRWRTIIDAIAPHVAVEDPRWHRIWARATGALSAGFDIDGALTVVAHQLAARADSSDPMPDQRFAEHALTTELAHRAERGDAHTPAVPWLARPDFAQLRHYPGHSQYLHEMNTAIHQRVEELRADAIQHPPAWAAHVGARPDNPIIAEEWDELVGLAAAYRDTFHITTNDADQPLGDEPTSHGVKTRAWHDLTRRWNLYPHHTSAPEPAPKHDEFSHEFEFDDMHDRHALEPLTVLIRRYNTLARDGDEDRYLDILARYAPGAINAAAEPALLAALSRAQDQGWQAERLVRTLTDTTGLSWADDPAAVLTTRINDHTETHAPPARIATPSDEDIERWRAILRHHAPDAAAEGEQWQIVWRHAAGGASRGVDADAALTDALQSLTNPDPGYRHVGEALVEQLQYRHDHGEGLHPALPWQAEPNLATGEHHKLERLDALNAEIIARTQQLHDRTLHQRPQWTSSLGDRPATPGEAQRWDNVLRLAAAYRETYGITTETTPPLGTPPRGHGPQAQAWQEITNEWSHLMTTPDREDSQSEAMMAAESHRDVQDALEDEFHSGVAAHTDAVRDDADARRAASRDEAEDDLDHDRHQSSDLSGGLGY